MLNKLPKVTSKKAKRVGRGYGSGKGGHTSGRGMKGQKSRSGYKSPRPGFEGGQMPLSRRIPKLKGFTRSYFKSRVNKFVINFKELNKFEDGAKVNIQSLVENGILKPSAKAFTVKICAKGKLNKKLTIEDIDVSKSAKVQIEKKGGEVVSTL